MNERRQALRLAAFLFPLPRSTAQGANRERGKKRPSSGFFLFGGSHISPTAKRAKRGEKSRENGNRTLNAQRNTRHGSKISPYKPDKRHARTNTPPTARTPRKRPKKGNTRNAHETPTAAGRERRRSRTAGARHTVNQNQPTPSTASATKSATARHFFL